MTNSIFRIVPLPTAVAEAARAQASAGASDHAFVEVDAPTGYPCRHCLQWAEPGERVILFPFSSIEPGHPYSESGPIFVHERDCRPYEETAEYPAQFRAGRVLRAYDAQQNIIDAVALNGDAPESVITRLFANSDTAFLQARSASRGCFTMRIERA
ncbi:MAG: DUF1203 domain-containing protein [Chthoniobacterales bacterium]